MNDLGDDRCGQQQYPVAATLPVGGGQGMALCDPRSATQPHHGGRACPPPGPAGLAGAQVELLGSLQRLPERRRGRAVRPSRRVGRGGDRRAGSQVGRGGDGVRRPRPDQTLDPEALRLAVRERRGAHQAPKAVHVVPELPTTAVGKIDRRAPRARFWSDEARAVS